MKARLTGSTGRSVFDLKLSDTPNPSPPQKKYQAYLQTEHWRSMRRWALQRAGNRCQVCGSTTNLDVHHNCYDRLEHEWPEDLVVLCRRHHELFHGDMPKTEAAEAVEPVEEIPEIVKRVREASYEDGLKILADYYEEKLGRVA